LGARTLSASGRQLFTIDNFRDTGKPLLEVLADSESIFIKGLALFERRTLYTNIINDRSAVYYTTGIAKTDPFTNLDKIKINYLKGYEDVILDPEKPVESLEPVEIGSTVYGNINSGVQSFRSTRRIRLHERGLAGIQPGNYRVPLLITGMREAVEDVYENLNSAQSNEYLVQGTEEEAAQEEPAERPQSSRGPSKTNGSADDENPEKPGPRQHEAPTLALAP
jgi:hypothetical protein